MMYPMIQGMNNQVARHQVVGSHVLGSHVLGSHVLERCVRSSHDFV